MKKLNLSKQFSWTQSTPGTLSSALQALQALLWALLLGTLSSCMETPSSQREKTEASSLSGSGASGGALNPLDFSSGAAGSGGPTLISANTNQKLAEIGTQSALSSTLGPQSELKHIIDPFTGNYKTKVSIPKNYQGILYISGLNINQLRDKLLKVRFRFGRELEAVDIPATIGRAQGLTPQTNIEVLIMDLRDKPFQNVRLLYDLFDYNKYDSSTKPTQDPNNIGLYCRGLNLDYDPTFEPVDGSTRCDAAQGQSCRYAYAKIVDSGLYYTDSSGSSSVDIGLVPETPQIESSLKEFSLSSSDSNATAYAKNAEWLKMCLPDSGQIYTKQENGIQKMGFDSTQVGSTGAVAPNTTVLSALNSSGTAVSYKFKSPYRAINAQQWAIGNPESTTDKYKAIYDDTVDCSSSPCVAATSHDNEPNGLFRFSQGNFDEHSGLQSYLFPLATQMELDRGIGHMIISSQDPSLHPPLSTLMGRIFNEGLSNAGNSNWMDGCNARMFHYNQENGEHIGSCNVVATISLVYRDRDTGEDRDVIGSENNEIKLQLTRASVTNTEGDQLLFDSFPRCSSDQTCGVQACCFNNRCWDKNIVSQCTSEASNSGNRIIGASCSSDLECASLCCNRSTGRCAAHELNGTNNIFCAKPPGDSCVAKEFCRQDPVRRCFIVRTGLTPTGEVTCAKRCYLSIEHGRCRNGTCEPPTPVDDTTNFDPNAENRCDTAVDPPNAIPIP